MGRVFGFFLAAVGFGLIVLGLWVIFAFEKAPMPNGMPLTGPVIWRHPAAEAGDKLVSAGALCLLAAAVNNRGTHAPGRSEGV